MKGKLNVIEIGFVILIGIYIIMWAWIQYYNASPDEGMRYDICNYIYKHHALPHGGDVEIRNQIWGYSYAFFPILSYMISAIFMELASWFSVGEEGLLMAARMTNVLFGMGTTFIVLKIGGLLFNNVTKWFFTILIVLLPQYIFIFSYVNNDGIALFAVALILYMWIYCIKNEWITRGCIGLAIGVSICALSYYNAYVYILGSVFVCLMVLVYEWKNKSKRAELLKKGGIIASIVLVCCGWWFVRNYILYDGDILGLVTSEEYSQRYALDHIKPSNRITPKSIGESVFQMVSNGEWLKITIQSFIGTFGYMAIFLTPKMYKIYSLLFGVGILGICFQWKKFVFQRGNKKHNIHVLVRYVLIISMLLSIALSVYRSYTVDYQPQGRYIMPMLIPLMYFVTMGLRGWLDKFVKSNKIQQVLQGVVGVGYVALNIYIYVNVFYPFYGNA